MIAAMERQTTRQHLGTYAPLPAAVPPTGAGWQLEAASVVASQSDGGYDMFYFWQRAAGPTEPCVCGAMARRTSPADPTLILCLSCGTLVGRKP